jgi:hypothetical protein
MHFAFCMLACFMSLFPSLQKGGEHFLPTWVIKYMLPILNPHAFYEFVDDFKK